MSVPVSLKRRSKGPILGPLTDAGVGLAVSPFVIDKVKSVRGRWVDEFDKNFSELANRLVGDIPSDGVRSPEGREGDPPCALWAFPRSYPQAIPAPAGVRNPEFWDSRQVGDPPTPGDRCAKPRNQGQRRRS